jgi:hypothetical protein
VDIGARLRGLALERYEEAFRTNDIDAAILPQLTAENLIAIGVASVGHRASRLPRSQLSKRIRASQIRRRRRSAGN